MRILTIEKNDAGQRLDKFLTKAVKGLPQSLLYQYIRTKKIKRNRKRAEPSDILVEGDTIQLFIREEFFDSPSKDAGAIYRITPKLEIVYEDENILLLNKRPGVLVHEDQADSENTLILHVKAYLAAKGEYDPAKEQSFSPALCNRIDRNTGGIVIAAKNAEALRTMNEKIKQDEVKKSYLCAAHGLFQRKSETLTGYLKKDEKKNLVDVSDSPKPGYKQIITKYRVLSHNRKDSLLYIDLVTGRTHQIRAHLAHIGHPLLGDGKYGVNKEDRAKGYKFQALYAVRLSFHFSDDGGILKNLNGKSFTIPREDVWFLKDFPPVEY